MRKKNWWELTAKERIIISNRSDRIFWGFDGPNDRGSQTGKGDYAIEELVLQVVKKETLKLEKKIKGDDPEELLLNYSNLISHIGFAIGYVFGQLFDLPHPKLLKDVEALKNKLKEKRCFTYLPREKKAA